ncbi:MAG TPA: Uma2 family endonuclease [Thermoanaerobaculia bacterium]|jgi:Uma2 family endonuclease|nr:Uma2 family endonuclease [Thermoanaerobaculia bacterium]
MEDTLLTRDGLTLTEDEFYEQEGEDSPYQYLGGQLVIREPVSFQHEDICLFLHTLLRIALDERGGAVAQGFHYPMRLDPKWSPEPDIMVVLDQNRRRIGPQRLAGPADLVIEVASPDDVRRALRLKLPRYREAGIPEIWVVDPWVQSVQVEVLTAEIAALDPLGSLGSKEAAAPDRYRLGRVTAGRLASAVLPWFWIDVSWLWQSPMPSTLACVRQILA